MDLGVIIWLLRVVRLTEEEAEEIAALAEEPEVINVAADTSVGNTAESTATQAQTALAEALAERQEETETRLVHNTSTSLVDF